MRSTLTFFEHELQPFEWTTRDLAFLAQMKAAYGAEVLKPTVRGRQKMMQAAQHVGVVRFGERTVQILPKIHRAATTHAEQQVKEANANLLAMLEIAGHLPKREYSSAPLLQRKSDWFEILTHLFAVHLREEWQRGAHRTYQIVEAELPLLKGKWRISQQLQRPERKHLFAVAYDEFTADNPLNRVFRFVVERLWRLTNDAGNRQLLHELRQWMEDVTLLSSVTSAQASTLRLTRLNARFEPLLRLAQLFLDHSALQMAEGSTPAWAQVFDMNALFEDFIIHFIRRHRGQILPDKWQHCELLPQSVGAKKFLAKRGADSVFRLKPDLALRTGADFPLLLDTKYKVLDGNKHRLGIAESDFYQMFAYAHRYACDRVLLLYPQTSEMPQSLTARFDVEASDKTIAAATVDLRVDLGQSAGRQQLTAELRQIFQGVT